jgi:hypothetical protein
LSTIRAHCRLPVCGNRKRRIDPMKKFKLISALIVLMSVAGCHHGMFDSGVAGSGNRQKQKRDVSSFTSISTEGAYEIDIVCQQPVGVEIEADDNILPLISMVVSNNVLHIENSRGYSVSQSVKLKISVPTLEGISIDGAGRVEVSGLKNEKFEIDANGAPTIRVSGETKLLEIDANGAGNIDTHNLRASKAVVDSKGVSKVDVRAADQLDVTVSGPSHVTYVGDPVVNKTVNGPGSVEKKASSGS